MLPEHFAAYQAAAKERREHRQSLDDQAAMQASACPMSQIQSQKAVGFACSNVLPMLTYCGGKWNARHQLTVSRWRAGAEH